MGGIFLAADALHLRGPERCAPLGEPDKARLISFVRQKYNLPDSANIGVADGGTVLNSCFRDLVFANMGGKYFRAELFASPDFRFLTSDLLDARPDPKAAAEHRRQNEEALVNGNIASRGDDKAPVTLAIFSDFQCPYCARFKTTTDELAAAGGAKLRIVYRYFPLSIHPWARKAAQAAACAQRQSNAAFWSLHDFLFSHQKELSPDKLEARIAAIRAGSRSAAVGTGDSRRESYFGPAPNGRRPSTHRVRRPSTFAKARSYVPARVIPVGTASPKGTSSRKSCASPLVRSISQRWELPALISSNRNLPARSRVVKRNESVKSPTQCGWNHARAAMRGWDKSWDDTSVLYE